MEAYALIEDVAEKPSIEYDTIVDLPDAVDEAAVAELYREELDRVARRERERGLTLIGPHRDELVFRLNDLEVRRYASQGQHRTFGMALKLAKYFYLREQAGELPLLLLDDVFDTLDARRTRAFLDLLETDEVGQSLITAAQRALLDGVLSFEAPGNQTIYVESGTVHAEPAAEM
jgi:DNA replication and repair protein RecF